MKSAALFVVRAVVLTVALVIVFMIAVNVSGMNSSSAIAQSNAGVPATEAQQAAATLPPLLAYAFLISIVFGWIIQNARWRGLKLIAALSFMMYGMMTVVSQVETIVYLRTKMPPGLISRLFVMGAVVALLFVPLATLIMGKLRGKEELPQSAVSLPLGTQAARFGLLAIVYVVLYYLFGYYVAWINPDVRVYYTGSTELKPFFEQMYSTVTGTPWMLPFQLFRGVLWALFAYPVVRMLKTTRLETTCTIAALFAIWSFVLLMPNPLMPASVAHSHFWETLWCDLILGAVVGWILTRGNRVDRTQPDTLSAAASQ